MIEPAPVTLDTVIIRDPSIVDSRLDDEIVMMSIEQGKYFGLDPIGSRIWEALTAPLSVRALCDAILPDYDVDRQQGERDILAFVQQLRQRHVVRIDEPTAPHA